MGISATFFQRPAAIIERTCSSLKSPGYELEERPPKEEKAEDDDTTTKKYVTDDDVFPRWPGDWLPRDWRLGFRELPSGLHRIHVPPNQDRVPKNSDTAF